jgi:hypothetical protein
MGVWTDLEMPLLPLFASLGFTSSYSEKPILA